MNKDCVEALEDMLIAQQSIDHLIATKWQQLERSFFKKMWDEMWEPVEGEDYLV